MSIILSFFLEQDIIISEVSKVVYYMKSNKSVKIYISMKFSLSNTLTL